MSGVSLPQHDELYAVSDIHMGGGPGFQIFKQGPRLGNLARSVAATRPAERVALVLNGDVIDSLAEEIGGYVAMDDAESMMDRLYKDPAFEPVWEGLADFVRTPGRTLVVVVGNHDIEMALPIVQRSIRTRLAGNDDAANGRILFATQGTGYACMVGQARVFCTHGNEVDGWNVVDYEALRRLAISQSSGSLFDRSSWEPNAGTRLVKDVMNQIKLRHPWIDLLKPENTAALGVLVVMDPGQADKIRGILPLARERLRGELVRRGWLSAEERQAAQAAIEQEVGLRDLLGPNLLTEVQRAAAQATDADALLREVEESVAKGVRPLDSPPVADTLSWRDTLGWGQMMLDRLRGVDKVEALRRALLDWLETDRSFDVTDADSTFKDVTASVGATVNFVITGHTHLERALPIQDGAQRFYYNCGTWIRLLRFTNEMLTKPATFSEVFKVLETGDMELLDRATIPAEGGGRAPFVLDCTSVVRISAKPEGVVGTLCHVVDSGPSSVDLQPVPRSEFWRRG